MGLTRDKARASATGGIPTALTVGVAAAAAAGVATDQIGTPAASAAAAGATAAVIGWVATYRFVIASARDRQKSADRLVLETQRELREQKADRAARRELERALDQAESEEAVLVVVRHALARHFGDRPLEVHVVHPVEPLLSVEIALSRPEGAVGHRSSPWEPLATRNSTTLVYDSTERVDVCPHLRSRAGTPSSAVAVPMIATDRIIGLIYAFGPNGEMPDPAGVTLLEEFASVIASRLALTRTPAPSDSGHTIDELTGLPDRGAMQKIVIGLITDRTPFSIGIADIDDLGVINAEQGRQAGDAALALWGRISRRTIRPDDIVGRIGGDELLFVMPHTSPQDMTRALERLREELLVSQASPDAGARFTTSIGVVGSGAGLNFDTMLRTASAALAAARDAGGNRIVIGEPVHEVS